MRVNRLNKLEMPRLAIVAISVAMLAMPLGPARAQSSPVIVKMQDQPPSYAPQKLNIKVGTTVQWTNAGEMVHTVSTTGAANRKDASVPKGAAAMDSGFIPPGGNYSYTFAMPGTYRYVCLPQEKAGMLGTITVKK